MCETSQTEVNQRADSLTDIHSNDQDVLTPDDNENYNSLPCMETATIDANENECDPALNDTTESTIEHLTESKLTSVSSKLGHMLRNLEAPSNDQRGNYSVGVEVVNANSCSDLNLEMNSASAVPRVFLCGVDTVSCDEQTNTDHFSTESSNVKLTNMSASRCEGGQFSPDESHQAIQQSSSKRLKRRLKMKRKLQLMKSSLKVQHCSI